MDKIELTEAERLAEDVLVYSRNTLRVNLRFLDMALSKFTYYPLRLDDTTIMTDGQYMLYNARYILKNYKRAKEISVRGYLHMVMHCIFGHMFTGQTMNHFYWDLACDIAVENIIDQLAVTEEYLQVEPNPDKEKAMEMIKEAVPQLTAEKNLSLADGL